MGVTTKSNFSLVSSYKDDMSVKDLEDLALQLRRDIIELTWFSGTQSSHLGGELSAAEIMAVLYGKILRLDPKHPEWEGRDRIILSKGHASGVLYAAMAWRGFFERDRLWDEFNRVDGKLQEHANMELAGIEAPTGSLGMGLSNGCGMAWASRLKHNGQRPPFNIYVVLGDGECTEGQTWEAIMCASHLELDNLIVIVDYNKYIISGATNEIVDLEPFKEKWDSFGWHVQVIPDGHCVSELLEALETAKRFQTAPRKPRAVIAHTVKGKGISFMERDAIHWHSGHLDKDLYEQCMKELSL